MRHATAIILRSPLHPCSSNAARAHPPCHASGANPPGPSSVVAAATHGVSGGGSRSTTPDRLVALDSDSVQAAQPRLNRMPAPEASKKPPNNGASAASTGRRQTVESKMPPAAPAAYQRRAKPGTRWPA